MFPKQKVLLQKYGPRLILQHYFMLLFMSSKVVLTHLLIHSSVFAQMAKTF